MQTDLQFIKEDISAADRHRMELCHSKDRYSMKLRMLGDVYSARKSWPSSIDKSSSGPLTNSLNLSGGISTGSFQNKKVDGRGHVNPTEPLGKGALGGSDSQHINLSGQAIVRKKRIHAQVGHFCRFLT